MSKKKPQPVAAAATGEPDPTAPPENPPPADQVPLSDAAVAKLARDSRQLILRGLLSAPFQPHQVKWKPQMVKNNRALAMAYIDARVVEDRLDDALGVENWTDRYEVLADGSVVCALAIRYAGGDWVTKSDVGSPSDQPDPGDRLKAAFSDALKRAAVKFGIGRYLYRLAAQWVDYDPVKKQLVRPPALPQWALPKHEDRAAAAYDDPDEPVAAAAALGPQPEKTPKVDNTELIANRVREWTHELTGCQTPDDLTKLLPRLADEPAVAKDAVKAHITKTAESVGWFYDAKKGGFVARARPNRAETF